MRGSRGEGWRRRGGEDLLSSADERAGRDELRENVGTRLELNRTGRTTAKIESGVDELGA